MDQQDRLRKLLKKDIVIVEKKQKKKNISLQQQIKNLQQAYNNRQQDAAQIFSVLDLSSSQNFKNYYQNIVNWAKNYGQTVLQPAFNTLRLNNNEANITNLRQLNRQYQNQLRLKLVDIWKQFKNKKLIIGQFQIFQKNFQSNLITHQIKFSDLRQDERQMILNQHNGPQRSPIPRNYLIIPKFNFITFLHGIKSTSLQHFITFSGIYQFNRLMQYLGLVRHQNLTIYIQQLKKQRVRLYFRQQSAFKIIPQIYNINKKIFQADFTKLKTITVLFQAIFSFVQTSSKCLAIHINKTFLQMFKISRQQVFYQPKQILKWKSTDQKQFLNLIKELSSLENYIDTQWVNLYYNVADKTLKQLQKYQLTYKMNQNIELTQPLNNIVWKQIFNRFRFLARQRYFTQIKQIKNKIRQQAWQIYEQDEQKQSNKTYIYQLFQTLAVGICAKTRQYIGIINIIKKNNQQLRSSLSNPKQYTWNIFLEIILSQQPASNFSTTTIRIKKQIKMQKSMFIKQNFNDNGQIQQAVETITNKVFNIFVEQFRQRNSYYHQLWTTNPLIKIQISKLQALSSNIKPIPNNIFLKTQRSWIWGVIFYTSSLQQHFWRTKTTQLVSLKKVWTVYSGLSLKQDLIKQFQYQTDTKISHLNCFFQILVFLNQKLNNPLNMKSSYQQWFEQTLKSQSIIKFIIMNQDIQNLARYLKINLYFIRNDFKQFNVNNFYGISRYAIYVYNNHADVDYDRAPIYVKQRQYNPLSSIIPVRGKNVAIKQLINKYRAEMDLTSQKFKKVYINSQFAYMDLQTYATMGQIMPIYLAVLVVYTSLDVYQSLENNRNVQKHQQSQNVRQNYKITITLEQQSINQSWFGRKCRNLKQLTSWLMCVLAQHHYKKNKQPLFWWTFNGLKFDYVFIMQFLVKYGLKYNSYGMGRQCKGLRNQFIILQDTRNFFPSGNLKTLTNQNNTVFKKKDFEIGLIKTQDEYIQKRQQIIQYCKYDCYSLQQLTSGFFENLYKMFITTFIKYKTKKNCQKQMDNIDFKKLIQRPTASNISLYFFRTIFLNDQYQCPDTYQQIQQQKSSFSGGMVQIYNHIIPQQSKIFEVDACSMYPTMMKYLPLWSYFDKDWLACENHEQYLQKFIKDTVNCYLLKQFLFQQQIQNYNRKYSTNQTVKSQINFYNALTNRYCLKFIKFQDDVVPYISKRSYQSLWYSRNINTKRWVSGFTILFLLANDCQFQIQKIRLRSSFLAGKYQNPFYQFCTLCYKQRLIFKKQQKKGLADCFKLMMNSVYGKLIQKKFKQLLLQYPNLFQQPSEIIRQCQQFVYHQKQQQQQQRRFSGDLVAAAGTITQLSRLRVSQIIKKIGIKHCFYGDTDSIYVDQYGKNKLQQLKIFFRNRDWDGDELLQQKNLIGDYLGQWKIQNQKTPFTRGVFISRKCLVLYNEYTYWKKRNILISQKDQQLLQQFFKQQTKNKIFNSQKQKNQFSHQWYQQKFYKVRLKGINFKPLADQCQLIIQQSLKSYKKAFLQKKICENHCLLRLQIQLKFRVIVWKKLFYEKQKGVRLDWGDKSIAFNFKRIPRQDGTTLAISGFNNIGFGQFEK